MKLNDLRIGDYFQFYSFMKGVFIYLGNGNYQKVGQIFSNKKAMMVVNNFRVIRIGG